MSNEHPCSKESTITAIEVMVENIGTDLKEQRELLKEFVDVLKQISKQQEQITGLKSTDTRHESNFNNLFPRVGALEVKAEGQAVRVAFIIAGCSVVTSLATGAVIKVFFGH